jgi:hypothetical protein
VAASFFSLPVPILLAALVAFAPALAAAWRHRWHPRDPLAQVAFAWLVMAVVGLAGILRWMTLGVPPWLSMVGSTELFPVLLLPVTLRWVGPSAFRWRWLIILAWVEMCMLAHHTLPDGRTFRLVMQPMMALMMTAASASALAARVLESRHRALSEEPWFWILTAHVAYFASDIWRQPLIETAVARWPSQPLAIHNGFMMLYTVLYLMIAWATMLREPVRQHRTGGVVAPISRSA